MADLIGKTLGNYLVVECIGWGGMATVYKAYQPALERYVAIKVLPNYPAHDPDFTARFKREAKSIARLNHPHILPVYDFGQEEEISYIVMRYVDGGTLKGMLGEPLELEQVVELVAQLGAALDYAHRHGVVHRDVKPANILMGEEGWPFLSDFGLARMVKADAQLTKSGGLVGTPDYVSPEQGQGIAVDARSDVYSLGAMLYEMLTGQVPYEADTPMAVVLKHITEPVPSPRKVNPVIPEAVERVVLKAMAKAPDDRYQRAGELAEALRKAASGVMVEEAVAVSTEEAVPVWQKAPLWAWGAVGGVVLLLLVGGILWLESASKWVLLASPPTTTPTATSTRRQRPGQPTLSRLLRLTPSRLRPIPPIHLLLQIRLLSLQHSPLRRRPSL